MGAYFRTGDQVSVDSKGVYTIKGRISMDIIKHKGYKISALGKHFIVSSFKQKDFHFPSTSTLTNLLFHSLISRCRELFAGSSFDKRM